MGKIEINGKVYEGNNLQIRGNTVIIDGKVVNGYDEKSKNTNNTLNNYGFSNESIKKVDIQISGNIQTLIVNADAKITGGNIEDVTVNGDLEIKGSVNGNVETNGDLRVDGSVNGSVRASGDMQVKGSVLGNATANGDLVIKNKK